MHGFDIEICAGKPISPLNPQIRCDVRDMLVKIFESNDSPCFWDLSQFLRSSFESHTNEHYFHDNSVINDFTPHSPDDLLIFAPAAAIQI
jgi:hypothetical protein